MHSLTKLLTITACFSALAAPALASPAPTLKIENFIGTVEVTTGNYDRVTVTDDGGASIEASTTGVTIDDDLRVNNISCKSKGKRLLVRHKAKGQTRKFRDINTYPNIKITAPTGTHVVINHAMVVGNIGTIGSGDIHVSSCGDLKLGDVNGDFDLTVSGSGDVAMGAVGGDMDLGISGSGDVKMKSIAGDLDLGISGSGDAVIGNAGAAEVGVSGSGDLVAGNVESLNLRISGSGDVALGDVAGEVSIGSSGSSDVNIGRIGGGLTYTGSGSSDFDADYVGGDLWVKVGGNGDIIIGDGNAAEVYIKASGASTVDYGGKAVNVEARASGASDINIHQPSGKLRASEGGAGDVNVR